MPTLLSYAPVPKVDRDTSLPQEKGQTRTMNGALEYMNPMIGTWQPAVRLQSLRPGILQRANPSQYTYAKKHNYANGKNPTDYTSFYAPWQGCGKDRVSRSPLLFQIQVANAHKQEPTGYMMDRTRIVLDAWDHGIRDFRELPEAISSALEGHDVEDLMRRNLAIKLYDVLARMPDGFFTGKNGEKWHEGPPRPGTVSMRATRFRLKAGCISWEPKAGSEKIADYILKLLPQSCIDANSTLSFRDLSKDEQEDATKPNEGTQPNRASKAKRAATVEKENKAKQMKRREKEMTEDTHTYGEDKLGSRYGEQDYTTANDAWLLEAIDRATNSSPKKNPYSTRSPELAIGQNLKRGAIHELRESDDVGGSGVRSLKRQRENPVPNATSHDLNAENVPTKMRRSSGKMPSSIATSRHSRKQALKQPLQYDEIFANDISQIVRAGNVHTYTSTPWTAFGDLGPAQEQYTSPRPSCINDPIDQLTEYNDPSNPFIFGGSNPQSHPFDGSFMPLSARALDHNMIPASSPLFDIHYADEYNSPQLPLNAHYANGFCSPQFGDAMTFDTQLPTNFAAPNPPIRKEGAIPSILHRRQAGNLKLNHSAVLTRQDGDTVPARQSHGSTPPLAGTAILKRKRAPETTESPNEPRQDAESRLTKRAKTYQQVQADLAKDLAMVPNVLDSPVAEATSEHTGGLQPENVASLPLEPLGVHAINDLNVQSYSAQDDGWSKEAFEENGSGFHLPSAFDPGYDAENYMPSYQQDREAHAKNNDYEESFAPPTEQLPVWIEDLAGWGPRNEEAQIVLDML